MNSEPGIWNTLIHREVAEVNGGPTRLDDQQFGTSDDLFIDGCSLSIERSADSSGNALGFAPDSAITEYLYNQQYYDVISGQYYMRARNYDPATGTFTQQDSLTINPGDLANANLFLFAGADPINMFDPTGRFGLTDTLAAISIATILTDIVATPVLNAFQLSTNAKWMPDAGVIGVEGSSTVVGQILNAVTGGRYSALAPYTSGTIGGEVLFDIRSSQLAVFVYGGLGASNPGNSYYVYSGLVGNLQNANEYGGAFISASASLAGVGVSGFASIGGMTGAGPWGVTAGRALGAGISLSATWYIGRDVSFPSMAEAFPMAALWAAATTQLFAGWMPAALVGAADGASYWPYFKWSDPTQLQYLQTHDRYGALLPPGNFISGSV